MILPFLLIILIGGALLAALSSNLHKKMPFYISLTVLTGALVWLLSSWAQSATPDLFSKQGQWIFEYNCSWITPIGASINLAMDGLSYIMVLLTLIMGIVAVMLSGKTERQGFFFFNTLLIIAGVTGILIAFDMLLFFFFWEMMLVPLYFLIAAYSRTENNNASFKFLVYTQASGLLMLLAILALYFYKGEQTAILSFSYFNLIDNDMPLQLSLLVMFGFLAAFFVKLPVVPFHGWLPGTFLAAPGAAIITGLLIKTGAYGILRFAIPLLPDASMLFAPAALILGLITIFYGAFLAFSQNDLRLIAAYSSISHMGFIIVGLYSFSSMAWQGVVIQMIASGISVSALIIMAEWLLKKTGTCDISKLGRLWEPAPVMSGLTMFFVLASLGLPGLANFVAEFLILAGTFKVSVVTSVLASLGVVAAAAYSLRIVQKALVGNKNYNGPVAEVNWLEKTGLGIFMVLLLWIGLNPKPVMDRAKPAIDTILGTQAPADIMPVQTNNNEASV